MLASIVAPNAFDVALARPVGWRGRIELFPAVALVFRGAQFWIDRKNLYFVRMLRPTGKDGAQTQETQFNKYQRLGGGWMSPEVIFYD